MEEVREVPTASTLEARLQPLREAIVDFYTHQNEQVLATVAYPRVRAFGSALAWRLGVPQEVREDALQELQFYFVRELVPLYDPSRPLAPFLYTYMRTFLARFRSHGSNRETSLDADDRWEDMPAPLEDDDGRRAFLDQLGHPVREREDAFAEEVDQRAAIRQVASILSRSRVSAAVPFAFSSKGVVAAPVRAVESPERTELRTIIQDLHYTTQEMAEAINMPVETLRAKLKGYNAITAAELERARSVARQMSNSQRELMAELTSLKMSEIIERWMRMLGWHNQKKTRGVLSFMLGISDRTLERYAQDETRATDAALRQYEARLRAFLVDQGQAQPKPEA